MIRSMNATSRRPTAVRWKRPAYLLLIAACGGDGDQLTRPDPNVEQMSVIVARTGSGSDADGVVIEVTTTSSGAHRSVAAALGDTVLVDSLAPGPHSVRLSGLAMQCRADPQVAAVTITAGVAETRFTADCVGQFAYGRWFGHTRADVHYLDEQGVDRMLFNGAFDIVRDWSPDGRHMLVERWIEDRCETYRVGLDGSVRRLLEGPTSVASARWSPVGGLIAVQVGPCAGFVHRIDVVLLDAQTLAPVDTIESTGIDVHPVWSPDGTELAFVRSPRDLYVYVPTSRQLVHVAQFSRSVDFPLWSPDNKHIALVLFGPQQVVAVARTAGTPFILTADSLIAVGGAMAWFPDGRTIGFAGLHTGTEMLFTANVDDRVTRRFTDGVSNGSALTVSSSSQVLFVSRPLGVNELFMAGADGRGVRRVKAEAEQLVWPLWRTGAGSPSFSVGTMPARTIRPGVDGQPSRFESLPFRAKR